MSANLKARRLTTEQAKVDPADLPRLVYFADVTVEDYMHGSALIYRLLEAYPADRLLIVEGLPQSQPARRLPGTLYRQAQNPIKRLLRSRIGPHLSGLYARIGGDGAGALANAIGDFAPEAVLTVVDGYQWQSAAAYCRRTGLPLHLIAHDRWQDTFAGSAALKAHIAPVFARAYRDAASRFCVSPEMARVYVAETGADAEVLYPARRRSFEPWSTVSSRVAQPGAPFTAAYAGSIPDQGLIDALALALEALRDLGGQLLIFGPYTREGLQARGLAGENLIVAGSAPPHALARRLREEADLLLASVTFDERVRTAMELCFPSKLTDYTAVGAPILVHGPFSCSAASWARAEPGVADVVDTMDLSNFTRSLKLLMHDRPRRQRLAETALRVGALQFASDGAEQMLLSALVRAQKARSPRTPAPAGTPN